jgi:uncharacterized membrane protein (UPF0127 family)
MLTARGRPFVLRDLDSDTILATAIEAAFDSSSRRRGLLGRTEFINGAALIIAPCSAIHTCFMRMAIDIVFVSRDGRVLKTYSSLRPWRAGFAIGAFVAIEFPAGTLMRSHTKRGHHVALTPS